MLRMVRLVTLGGQAALEGQDGQGQAVVEVNFVKVKIENWSPGNVVRCGPVWSGLVRSIVGKDLWNRTDKNF